MFFWFYNLKLTIELDTGSPGRASTFKTIFSQKFFTHWQWTQEDPYPIWTPQPMRRSKIWFPYLLCLYWFFVVGNLLSEWWWARWLWSMYFVVRHIFVLLTNTWGLLWNYLESDKICTIFLKRDGWVKRLTTVMDSWNTKLLCAWIHPVCEKVKGNNARLFCQLLDQTAQNFLSQYKIQYTHVQRA